MPPTQCLPPRSILYFLFYFSAKWVTISLIFLWAFWVTSSLITHLFHAMPRLPGSPSTFSSHNTYIATHRYSRQFTSSFHFAIAAECRTDDADDAYTRSSYAPYCSLFDTHHIIASHSLDNISPHAQLITLHLSTQDITSTLTAIIDARLLARHRPLYWLSMSDYTTL
jgi:hypothetical protein